MNPVAASPPGDFIQGLAAYVDLGRLLQDWLVWLDKVAHPERALVILHDPTDGSWVTCASWPSHPDPGASALSLPTRISRHLAASPATPVVFAGKDRAAASRTLQALGFACAFPLRSRNQLIGVLLLGRPREGAAYSPESLTRLSRTAEVTALFIDQLRQADGERLLGAVSSGLIHDLKSLLTPVSTTIQLLAGGPTDWEKARSLQTEAEQAVKAIQLCLRQARSAGRDHSPEFRLLRLDTLVRQAVALVKSAAEARQISLHVQSPEVNAEVNEALFQRLLKNLLNNALHAMPPNGRVRVQLRATSGAAPQAVLCVTDSGPGLSAEARGRIARSRLGVRNPLSQGEGTGLGLAICARIVQIHQGELRIGSVRPPGTTVTVRLPLRQFGPSGVAG